MWTLDELVERVREALAAEYPGAPNGRVRDMPDRRAIRWYTTIGLVDRPLGMRGRTALYGPRHLQQLVAIKRRQAEGRSLAEIQVEFAWISDEALGGVSRVPKTLLDTDEAGPGHSAGTRARFWAESPSAGLPPSKSADPQIPPPPATRAHRARGDAVRPDSAVREAAAPARRETHRARPISGVALGGGAILLLPHLGSDRDVSDRDRDDITAAAAPLLDLLQARGLIDGRPS